ncbi:MAG: glycosyltransferase [Paludibaculum sp.]
MKIAVEAACWLNGRGYGRHLRSLMRALLQEDHRNQYTLCFDYQPEPGSLPEGCEVRVAGARVPAALAASAAGRRSVGDMCRLSRLLSDPRFDLILFPTVYSYVPVTGRATRLVMIHDVIAETFPHLTVPSPAARLFWNLKVAWARRQADAVVTVSEYAKRGILDRFHLPEDRVFLAGEASDAAFRRLDRPALTPLLRSLGLTDGQRFVVYVGGFSPHKNLDALVRAFASLQDETVRLVLVGDYQREVFQQLTTRPSGRWLIPKGWRAVSSLPDSCRIANWLYF